MQDLEITCASWSVRLVANMQVIDIHYNGEEAVFTFDVEVKPEQLALVPPQQRVFGETCRDGKIVISKKQAISLTGSGQASVYYHNLCVVLKNAAEALDRQAEIEETNRKRIEDKLRELAGLPPLEPGKIMTREEAIKHVVSG